MICVIGCNANSQSLDTKKVLNDSISLVKTAKPTKELYKGRAIYLSMRGKKFVIVKSRTGNYYKKYII